jgi:hypothetical protein
MSGKNYGAVNMKKPKKYEVFTTSHVEVKPLNYQGRTVKYMIINQANGPRDLSCFTMFDEDKKLIRALVGTVSKSLIIRKLDFELSI